MLPVNFQSDYPCVARGLLGMLGEADTSGVPDDQNRQALATELTSLMANNAVFDTLFTSLWAYFEQSPSRLLKFSIGAYHHLDVSDGVRDFVGRLWASAMAAWDEALQQDFLLRILREDRFFLFEALDFAPSIFLSVPVDAGFMASWVKEAREAVGNDLYQRGLWRCFENYARHQPGNALRLISSCFADSVDRQLQTVLARMLSWIRSSELEVTVQQELKRIENALRMTGSPDL